MKRSIALICSISCSIFSLNTLLAQTSPYTWLPTYSVATAIDAVVSPPVGYYRTTYPENSFGNWLRGLPIDTLDTEVTLFNGTPKLNQSAQAYILEIPVGKRDLQQCADAVMRLKAEYLFHHQQLESIHFNFTSGDEASFTSWSQGYRPSFSGNKVSWNKTASPDASYRSFLAYMNIVFSYAGTWSFEKELSPISLSEAKIGDVFIQGGFPGHAIIIVDEAINTNGEKVFLFAQSYMPAQEIHILKNPNDSDSSPWYTLSEATLLTPEWSFPSESIKRMQW
ncbi:MAG: DUF4846 domain-containing protein [Bacteroidota bacterium]